MRFSIILLSAIILISGCSSFRASEQPDKKDLSVLIRGTPRAVIIGELGQPASTDMKDGKRVDVFSFKQGYSKGAKTGRAFGHAAMTVATLGVWEVVGMPIESAYSGDKVAVQVTYDQEDKAEEILSFNGVEQQSGAPAEATHPTSPATQAYPGNSQGR